MTANNKLNLFYLSLIFFIIFLDRMTKLLMGIKAKNYGAAFGILPGYNILFISIALILVMAIGYYIKKANSKILRLDFSFILAGTIGNLIDRAYYGYVIDVIKIPFFNFPAFNIADLSNVFGALLLVIFISGKK